MMKKYGKGDGKVIGKPIDLKEEEKKEKVEEKKESKTDFEHAKCSNPCLLNYFVVKDSKTGEKSLKNINDIINPPSEEEVERRNIWIDICRG